MIVLDTATSASLAASAKALINRLWGAGGVAVCAMTFWEIALLQSRGRIRLPVGVSEWRERLLAAGLLELAVDGATAVRSVELGGLPEDPADPADRLIIAAALAQGAALMTTDERLLGWGHALERHDARV